MRTSTLLITATILLIGAESVHASTTSDYYPRRPSTTTTSRKKKKKRRRRKPPPKIDELPILSDDSLSDNPFEVPDDEDQERLLSALERIDNDERQERTERRINKHQVSNDTPTSTRAAAATKVSSVKPKATTQTPPRPSAPQQHGASPSQPRPETKPVPHSVTHHTYQQTPGSHPYPVPRRQMPQQTPPQRTPPRAMDSRTAMLSYTTPWVIKFLQGRPKDALIAVPRDFLADGFNLVHLPPLIERLNGSTDTAFPLYKAALRVILSAEDVPNVPPTVQRAAEMLYTLVHARFITSPRGLDTVRRLLLHDKTMFGKCPRPSCRGMPLLPHGETSEYSGHGAQRYCCACGQAWEFWDSQVDGSAWGRTFCHLYLLTYGNKELGRIASPMPQTRSTVPTVFGFQVHTAALRRLHEP